MHEASPCRLRAHVVLLCRPQRRGASVLWVAGLKLPCSAREKSGQALTFAPFGTLPRSGWEASPRGSESSALSPMAQNLVQTGRPSLASTGAGWVDKTAATTPSPALSLPETPGCEVGTRTIHGGHHHQRPVGGSAECHQPELVIDPEPPPPVYMQITPTSSLPVNPRRSR